MRTLHYPISIPEIDFTTLKRLDEWDNFWFSVISATLRHRFPKVHERVFHDLSQTASGFSVIINVSTLLERLDKIALPERDGGMGAEGQQAKELLEKRGLTAAVDEAREILKRVLALEGPEPILS